MLYLEHYKYNNKAMEIIQMPAQKEWLEVYSSGAFKNSLEPECLENNI